MVTAASPLIGKRGNLEASTGSMMKGGMHLGIGRQSGKMPKVLQKIRSLIEMMERIIQEIEGLEGMIGLVLQRRHYRAGMMIGRIQEVEGLIAMTGKLLLQGSKGWTVVTKGIQPERNCQIGRRAMEDQEGHLGVVDQHLQMSTGIGAGMNPIHHQGCPEVEHVLRCLVISGPSL